MPANSDDQVDQDGLRAARRDLQKRLERCQTFVALSAGWYWEQDENFRFIDLGVSDHWPAEAPPMGSLLGKARWEVPGLEIDGGWDAHRELLSSHLPFRNVEIRQTGHARAGVQVMRISGVPIFEDGAFRGYCGVGTDITEQAVAQAAAREIEREMSALMSNLPGMAYRCAHHRDWPMEFASEGALPLTGYSAEDLVAGHPHYGELIHPDDRDAVWKSVAAAIARRQQFQLAYRIQTPRSQKWVWEQGRAVYRPDGGVRCLEGFITDITASRRAQDEVARLNTLLEDRVARRTAELEAANRELEAFAYSIAHDLRAPLTSIAGFSRLLEQPSVFESQDRRLHYLKRISAGVTHMSDLTDALLSLAKLSRVEPVVMPIDLADMARQHLAQLQQAEPGRKVLAQIPDSLPARGDPRLVAQVISNLMGNAWKFSSKAEETWIEVGVKSFSGGVTAFFVRDRGEGFDMAYAARLFEPFQRLHTLAEFDGTGIGLALVHKIIGRHGGRIWADAQPGGGATFFFTLSG
jgi:PAS domain S-box-containing protein